MEIIDQKQDTLPNIFFDDSDYEDDYLFIYLFSTIYILIQV